MIITTFFRQQIQKLSIQPHQLLTIVFIGLTALNTNTSSATQLNEQVAKLQTLHQDFTSKFYVKTTLLPNNINLFNDLNVLKQRIVTLEKNQQHINSIQLIQTNLSLIKDSNDNLEILYFIKVLLTHEYLSLANKLIEPLIDSGDDEIIAAINFYLAIIDFRYQRWNKVLTRLEATSTELTLNERDLLLLLKGNALQALGFYRRSIAIHNKVTEDSSYYNSAQINLAISQLSQDWWTQGHKILEKLINDDKSHEDESLFNRLLIMLGYSQLKQQYYTDARVTFNQISTDSIYANQSLIGLSLSAIHQNDFIVALNTVRILKAKKMTDTAAQESHFLMAYYYEKSGHSATASVGYNNAVNYYLEQINQLQKLIDTQSFLNETDVNISNDQLITIKSLSFKLTNDGAISTLINYQNLRHYKQYLTQFPDQTLEIDLNKLQNNYKLLIDKIIINDLKQKIGILNSYIDQSRFGLIRLYENDKANNDH